MKKESKKSKGDFLESVVEMLEKALVTNPQTQIKTKHFIADHLGFERELDIYVETTVNRKVLKYAIECKNYGKKSPVKMSDIDVFSAKIEHSAIKGIFISTGKFQQKAIEKAVKLKIDLYTITETNEQLFKSISLIQKRFSIDAIGLKSSNAGKFPELVIDCVYMGKAKKKWPIDKFINEYLKPTLEKVLDANTSKLYDEFIIRNDDGIKQILNSRKPYILISPFSLVYFEHNQEFYLIEEAQSNITLWIELIKVETPKFNIYQTLAGDQIFAKFFTHPFTLNDNTSGYINMVKVEGSDEVKMSISTTNGSVELRDYGIFSPDSIEFKIEERK
jgi:hypothetical protein